MQYICIIDRVEEVNEYQVIGYLHNEGANPQAPYYEDMYTQELDTGADTFQFSTISNSYTQDLLEVGKYVGFMYNGKFQLFAITSLEYSHNEGYKTIGVYAEGIGFELLEVYMERPEITENGGNDSDNDGDDNTDDEYGDPDDVYIDADGNIIYIKYDNGEEPSADDVTIDGDGNIIYKPSRNKKNDSLELKNISYPTFLKLLLKDTNWEIICQPGLSSNKQNMSIRYDTNIYAILQDSMQTYQGVELEFVFESNSDNNGEAVRKVIKAYNNGGRGSFVGKRFEYGTNVRGITKTQKVANSEDDTILYIDDVGIEVYYDIDFALKSIEVPEIEIGDTHYVIDNTFYPPMTIKARIGKIEVSFSDPTRNKIYLANNKKIRGSVSDDIDEKAIKNIIDDNTISPEDYQDDMEDIYDTFDYGCEACLVEEYENGSREHRFAGALVPGSYIEGGDAKPNVDSFISIRQGTDIDSRTPGPGYYMDFALRYQYDYDWSDIGVFLKYDNQDDITVFGPYSVGLDIDLGSPNNGSCRRWNTIYSDNALNTCDIKYKENVIYLDDILETQTYSSTGRAETPFLDFIKNDFRPAMYNYKDITPNQRKMRQQDNQLGFIANDIIDTEVGGTFLYDFGKDGEQDIMVSSNGYITVVARALQEEVRIRDEEIANLKNRLEKIEALLDINDNE